MSVCNREVKPNIHGAKSLRIIIQIIGNLFVTPSFSVLMVTGVFLYFAPKLVSNFFQTEAIQRYICFQNVTSLPVLQFKWCNTHTDDICTIFTGVNSTPPSFDSLSYSVFVGWSSVCGLFLALACSVIEPFLLCTLEDLVLTQVFALNSFLMFLSLL